MKRLVFSGVFYRFAISYILLLAIMIAAGSFAYDRLAETGYQQMLIYRNEEFKNKIEMLDSRLLEIDNTIKAISLSEELSNLYLVKTAVTPRDYYKFIEFQNELDIYALTNDFIKSIVVYFKPSETIVTNQHIDDNPEAYYETFLNHDGIDYDEWLESFIGQERQGKFLSEQRIHSLNDGIYDGIRYVNYLPFERIGSYKVILQTYIDKNSLISLFDVDSNDVDLLEIYYDNELLTRNHNNSFTFKDNMKADDDVSFAKLNDIHYIIFTGQSDTYGLKYHYAVSIEEVMQDFQDLKMIALWTLGIVLMIGLSIAYLFAYLNSAPIRKLSNKLADEESKPEWQMNEIEHIERSIDQLMENNTELTTYLGEQKPLLQMALTERLFKGRYHTYESARSQCETLSIELPNKKFVVGVIWIVPSDMKFLGDNTDELQLSMFRVRQLAGTIFGYQELQYIFDEDKLAVPFYLESEADLETQCRSFIDATEEEGIFIKIGLSDTHEYFHHLSIAFGEAREAMEYKVHRTFDDIRWYKEIPTSKKGYLYSLEEEHRLMEFLKFGRGEEAKIALMRIHDNNFIHRSLTKEEIAQLLWEIKGTYMKVINQLNFQGDEESDLRKLIEAIDQHNTIQITFNMLRIITDRLSNYVCSSQVDENAVLIEKIKAYINEHYMEFDLSLTYVADAFEMTDKQLSSFFKEMTQEGFSTYILNIRMKEAERMLKETDASVAEISERVGYRNLNTFYRAFKRVYSMSPSTYKKDMS